MRIAREEVVRAIGATNAPTGFAGLRTDLDRSGAPLEPEIPVPVADLGVPER